MDTKKPSQDDGPADDEPVKYSETNRWHASWNAMPPKQTSKYPFVMPLVLAGMGAILIYFGFFYEEKEIPDELLYRPLKKAFEELSEQERRKK